MSFSVKQNLILLLAPIFLLFGASSVLAQNIERATPTHLESDSIETRRTILHLLRLADSPDASSEASKMLRYRAEIVRATAPFSVLALPADDAAVALIPQVTDKSEFVRRETAYALGETRSRLALDTLTTLLVRDKKYQVRCAAAVALGKIGDARAISVLHESLRRSRREDEDFLRRALAQSLGEIAQTFVFLQAFGANFGRDIANKSVWENILQEKRRNLLMQVPLFTESFDVLQKTLQKRNVTNDEKRAVAFAFGEIGDRRARPTLDILRQDADYYLAEISANSLLKLVSENSLDKR